MAIIVDWYSSPIVARSNDKIELSEFLDFLKKRGIHRHSIIMKDRDSDGFLFFIYSI